MDAFVWLRSAAFVVGAIKRSAVLGIRTGANFDSFKGCIRFSLFQMLNNIFADQDTSQTSLFIGRGEGGGGT